ncbi:MAG: hypothetical protein E4H28_03535 [Gemmatimonadales bacterium]|nr:MAG: hypothetical protein E4H28_03535 [Gemmatimonadales bacterium]
MNHLARLTMLCLVTISCSPAIPDGLEVVITDSAGVTIVTAESLEGLPVRSLVGPVVDLISSPDPAEASFSRVTAVLRLADGRFIVTDGASRRLKLFGPDGSYLRNITGADHSLAEFSAITAIWLAGRNRITVFDQRQRHLITLPIDPGNVEVAELTSANLRARPVGRLDAGDVLLRNLIFEVPGSGFELTDVAIIRFGSNGTLLDTVGVWPAARMGRLGEPPLQRVSSPIFEPRLVAAAAGNRLLLSDCRSAEYSIIDPGEGLTQVVRWPTPDLQVSEDDIRLYREQRLAGLDQEQQRQFWRSVDGIPVSENLPACDQLRIDSEGRTWIRSFVRPGSQQQEWLVFDPDGRPLFGIELPLVSVVMDLGANHVTVLENDSLDVQRVRVYEIE